MDIDGEAVRSCQVTIGKTEGRFVTTIEALSPDRGHPLQQAFAADNVSQCGYCIPGMIVTAEALLRRNPSPSRAEVVRALRHNLCRCGAYGKIAEAVLYLASDRARFVTGSQFVIDAGLLSR